MFKNKFTSQNIFNVDCHHNGDEHAIYDTGIDKSRPGVRVELGGDNNWGLAACASALLMVAQDFPERFPQYQLADNTGIVFK